MDLGSGVRGKAEVQSVSVPTESGTSAVRGTPGRDHIAGSVVQGTINPAACAYAALRSFTGPPK
jgi:hypothetical protein